MSVLRSGAPASCGVSRDPARQARSVTVRCQQGVPSRRRAQWLAPCLRRLDGGKLRGSPARWTPSRHPRPAVRQRARAARARRPGRDDAAAWRHRSGHAAAVREFMGAARRTPSGGFQFVGEPTRLLAHGAMRRSTSSSSGSGSLAARASGAELETRVRRGPRSGNGTHRACRERVQIFTAELGTNAPPRSISLHDRRRVGEPKTRNVWA